MSLSHSPVLAYHGCDAALAQDIIAGRKKLWDSTNGYDWLGSGIYFWVGSYRRALAWAQYKQSIKQISSPAVVCAFVNLGNCLNLTDFGADTELYKSYVDLAAAMQMAGTTLPVNSGGSDPLVPMYRNLDCAVIDQVHNYRQVSGLPAYDTVLGAFDEGGPAFPGAAIWKKSHIQLAVRNRDCILATFNLQKH